MAQNNIPKLSPAQKELLLSKSPYALPDNPSDKHFSASQIKRKMYEGLLVLFDYINAFIDSVNSNVTLSNQDLQTMQSDIGTLQSFFENGICKKATADANGNNIASTYETKSDALSKVGTALAEAKAYADALVQNSTLEREATSSLKGLMSANDKAHLDALYALLGDTADADNVVNTINEVLSIFSQYPEGTSVANALAGKVNTSDIVDDLTSEETAKPLSAKQGKTLKDLIDVNGNTLTNMLNGTQMPLRATQDAHGNDIVSTYATKAEFNAIKPNVPKLFIAREYADHYDAVNVLNSHKKVYYYNNGIQSTTNRNTVIALFSQGGIYYNYRYRTTYDWIRSNEDELFLNNSGQIFEPTSYFVLFDLEGNSYIMTSESLPRFLKNGDIIITMLSSTDYLNEATVDRIYIENSRSFRKFNVKIDDTRLFIVNVKFESMEAIEEFANNGGTLYFCDNEVWENYDLPTIKSCLDYDDESGFVGDYYITSAFSDLGYKEKVFDDEWWDNGEVIVFQKPDENALYICPKSGFWCTFKNGDIFKVYNENGMAVGYDRIYINGSFWAFNSPYEANLSKKYIHHVQILGQKDGFYSDITETGLYLHKMYFAFIDSQPSAVNFTNLYSRINGKNLIGVRGTLVNMTEAGAYNSSDTYSIYNFDSTQLTIYYVDHNNPEASVKAKIQGNVKNFKEYVYTAGGNGVGVKIWDTVIEIVTDVEVN